MDPYKCLNDLREFVSSGYYSNARENLANYREWRKNGGFGPPGGDKIADDLEKRLNVVSPLPQSVPYVPDPEKYIRTALDEYPIADLRETAGHWHGGQWSALYAFSSSGTVTHGLRSEASQCADDADNRDDCEPDESDKLRAIASLEPREV
jgi:hypothetical protein